MIGPPPERNFAYGEIVVSLDLIAPFLPWMGLGELDPLALRAATRRAIDRERAEQEPPPPSRSWPTEIEASLGAGARRRVDRWMQYVFEVATSDHQDWAPWHSTFAVVERSQAGLVSLDIAPVKASALLLPYLVCQDDRALYALEDSVRGSDLSLWDLEILSVHGMMPDDPDSLLWLWMRSASRNWRFQTFFSAVRKMLDAPEQDALFERARVVRRSKSLDPDRLVHPRSLQAMDDESP